MVAYITCMVLGGIFMVTVFSVYLFFVFRKKNKQKILKKIGTHSEILINDDIQKWAKIHQARFIPSSLFKYDNDKFFEVDSILITDKAIFVVEIKSITGKIVGDCNADTWNKVVNGKTFPITNPIKQNDKHIEHIQKMSNLKAPTISLIIYSNRCENIQVENTPPYGIIVRHVQLFETLDEINRSLNAKITIENMKFLEKTITRFATKNSSDRRKFTEIIKGGKSWK